MRIPRPLTAVAALLATALAGAPVLVSPADAAPDGERSPVSRAADRYDVSDDDVRAMLAADPDLKVSGAGLYYTDPAPTGKPAMGVIGQAFPLSQTFELHSKPGSPRTIFLDFDGHNVSGTWWNQAPTNLTPQTHPAWTLDGDASTFNDTERMWIQDVFQRVAEDYAPFDVDVTTQDPGAAAIIRAGNGDNVFGTRALITPSDSAHNTICGAGGCGGVAFIDVFDDPNLNGLGQPAFVFPQKLSNNSKWVADATTHEVGHNLSLMHDGTTGQGYYAGHNALWGPIMGAPYDVPITQWSLNDYPNAKLGGPGGDPDGLQPNPDDIVTINASGTPFRTDEPGSTPVTSGPVPSGAAYISSRTDVDFYNLGSCSGSVTVAAVNADVGPNLDIELQLLDVNGSVLDTDNPSVVPFSPAGMDATVSAQGLATGTYYARVDGVAPGSAASTYTDYGSVGAYSLQVSGCGQAVVVVPSAPQNLNGVFVGDGVVELSWNPPASNGGGTITHFNVYADGDLIGNVPGDSPGAQIGEVPPGEHEFAVAAVNSAGEGPQAKVTVQAGDPGPVESEPGPPVIGQAKPGKAGKPLTAKIRWSAPTGDTNPPVTGYQVIAFAETKSGSWKALTASKWFGKKVFGVVYTVQSRARVKFAVRARNDVGVGRWSSKSNAVRPQ